MWASVGHTERKRDRDGWEEEETGARWGKRVLVFMANLVYKVKSALYRFNLPVTARPLALALYHTISLPTCHPPQVVSR